MREEHEVGISWSNSSLGVLSELSGEQSSSALPPLAETSHLSVSICGQNSSLSVLSELSGEQSSSSSLSTVDGQPSTDFWALQVA